MSMRAVIKHLYYGYYIVMPGLVLGLLVLQPQRFPIQLWPTSPGLRTLIVFLIIGVIAAYLGTATELVPFPTSMVSALLSVLLTPITLAVAVYWNGEPITNVILMSFLVELTGILLFILFMVNKKFFVEKNHFWYGLVVCYLLVIGSIGCIAALWYASIATTWVTLVTVVVSGGSIAYRYYKALKQNQHEQEFAVQYILIGIALCFVLPAVAAIKYFF